MKRMDLRFRIGNMDNLSKLPLAELAGCGRVLIENHSGVLAYSPEMITVKVNYGCLEICGENMMLAEMRREQLVISGVICSINIHRR